MNAARRSHYSAPRALESVRVYRDALCEYSDEELEDVYFHIDVLREPVRYRIVQLEMARRGLNPEQEEAADPKYDPWIDRLPGAWNRPVVRCVYLTGALFLTTLAVMAAMLGPIWAFAVPWRFSGVQASLVYLALAPIVTYVGLWFGVRAGGWRPRTIAAPAALAVAIWTFYRCGGWAAIVGPLYRAGGGSGGLMGGW